MRRRSQLLARFTGRHDASSPSTAYQNPRNVRIEAPRRDGPRVRHDARRRLSTFHGRMAGFPIGDHAPDWSPGEHGRRPHGHPTRRTGPNGSGPDRPAPPARRARCRRRRRSDRAGHPADLSRRTSPPRAGTTIGATPRSAISARGARSRSRARPSSSSGPTGPAAASSTLPRETGRLGHTIPP